MTYSLDSFCKDCHDILKADPGPAGRERICGRLTELLKNKAFVEKHLGSHVAEGRHTLYQDKELKFVVLAHIDRTPRSSTPHDHGRSWAVYGQATGWSDMTIWRRRDGGKDEGPAEIEQVQSYRLMPGQAGIFNVGDIHGVDRSPEPCCYVRVTGEDLERVRRLKFDVQSKKATALESVTVGS